MKRVILILAIVMLAGNVWAADYCKNIEYGELKDMPKEDLKQEACINHSFVVKLFDNRPDISEIDQYFKDLNSCLDLEKRILRVYKVRKMKEPSCIKDVRPKSENKSPQQSQPAPK